MQVVPINTSKEILSSVSQKGQVTIPLEVRKRLGVEAKDKVAFRIERDEIKIVSVASSLEKSFQAIPALKKKMSVEQMVEIAANEHAQKVVNELP